MFKISYTQNTNFKPLIIINCIRQTKSKSNIYIYLIFNIASIILLISLFSHLNFKIKWLESFTKSTLEFWRQIIESGGGALLIIRKIVMLVSWNQYCTIFSPIFCLMFLIEGIKHYVEKKFKTCSIFFTRLFN